MGKFQCLLFVLKRSCIYYIICMTVLLNISKNSFEKSKSLFNLLQPATVLKRRLRHRCFSVNFVKIFKNTFFVEHFLGSVSERRLLRKMVNQHSYYNKEIVNSTALSKNTAKKVYVCVKHFWKGFIGLTRTFLCMLVKRKQHPLKIRLKEFYF